MFVAAASALHFGGRVRLAPLRQAGDHSSLAAPYNLLIYAASRTPAEPFIDPKLFPELPRLAKHWREIRNEALALQDAGAIRSATGPNDLGFHTFFKRGWTRFYLRW